MKKIEIKEMEQIQGGGPWECMAAIWASMDAMHSNFFYGVVMYEAASETCAQM